MPDIKFSNKYPYTDFHELNLDWLIKEVKYWSTKVGKTIQSIELTGTVGLVDTYTISYSDGSTSTFDVTNGNGIASVAKTGTAGLVDTYTITFQDGSTTTFEVHNGTASIDPTLTLSNYAADAKVTGDAISELKDTFVNDFCINPNVELTLEDGKFIDASNDSIGSSSGFALTNPIPVKKGQRVTLTATGYNTIVGMIATCNVDNTERSTVVKSIDSTEHDYQYIVASDGYIVCSFSTTHFYKLSLSIDYYPVVEILDIINAGTEQVAITVLSSGFIDATNNRYNVSTNFYLSNSIHLFKGQTVELTATGYNTSVGMICLYDSENAIYQTVARSIDSTQRTYSYTATEICDVRFSYNKSYPATAVIVTPENISGRLQYIDDEIEKIKTSIDEVVEYPQMFTNVICIGDSLTYGSDGQIRLNTNYPFYFGKLTGATISNQGLSGRTAKQWWDEVGSTFSAFANYDCAIIYLGTNGGLTDTVDTDCNASDYTQNANNNTGCYGKIIGKIKADAPDCKIFCIAGPSEYLNRDSTMNPAVRSLAEFYDVGLIDLSGCMMDDNGTTQSPERYLYRPIDGIHYNRLGYLTFANMVYDYMQLFMTANLTKYSS